MTLMSQCNQLLFIKCEIALITANSSCRIAFPTQSLNMPKVQSAIKRSVFK